MAEKQSRQSRASLKMFFRRYLAPMKYYFIFAVVVQLMFAIWDIAFFSLNGYMVDKVIPQGKEADLLAVSILLALAIFIVCSVFITLNFMVRGRFSQGLMHRIRQDVFGHLQKLSFSYFDQNTIGNLLARLTTDVKTYAIMIAWPLPGLGYQSTFIFGTMIYMLYLNWKISLIVFSMLPFTVAFIVIFQKRILAASQEVMGYNSKLTTAYNEGITGIRTIRSLAGEEEFIRKFEQMSQEMFRVSRKRVVDTAVFIPMIIATTGIGLGLLIWFGTEEVLAGGMSLGVLIILSVYTRFFSDNLMWFVRTIGEVQPGIACQDRLYRVLDAPLEIKDSPEVQKKIEIHQGKYPDLAVDGELARIRNIEFDKVGFFYKEDEPVLQDFNLIVAQGESIALVGETGAGKSTIVNLLCRFYEPTSGEIRLNDLDYRKRSLYWLQSNLGIVLQTPFLFNGTIRENIHFGNPAASFEQVVKAAETVNAHSFITNLDQGYDTPVGEEGKLLSSGQKQLVSFARAVLADPQILVLDEATSSVDPETEHLIQQGLKKVLDGRISFIIAHRLSTVREADRILLIDNGRIVEQGSHEELIGLEGEYKDLYGKQFLRHQERELLGSVSPNPAIS
ncbi:MAG: ABC transporter ATP-binding protein [Proteobacteria bacterium]|nr:ABC transporter ATP-binding protein [Pseudomonadota bacterium]